MLLPSKIGELSLHELLKGVRCPHCERFAKIYRRTLTGGPASQLIRLHRLGRAVKAQELEDTSKPLALLQHWGLINPVGKLWEITEQGIAFAEGRVTVSKQIVLYDGLLLGHDGGPWSIRDALGAKFDYAELMGYPTRPVRTPVRS